jgi:ectoine hydroxylase-related dioxygenase (phytanoyl-CoA dioxygenase family)
MNFTIFGVNEINKVNSDLDLHLENIAIRGYTIIKDVLNQEELTFARNTLDRLYKVQINEVGNEELLSQINDTNNVRAPLVYEDFFLHKVAANEKVLDLVKGILGDYFILMLQNGVFNMPYIGNKPNAYAHHRDLNYQHFVSSRPLAISALFCIDDFNSNTGGTIVIPYTHKFERCPSLEYISENEIQITSKPGSVIVFDSMMYHRSGTNTSNIIRRGINNMYVAPFIKQQISFPKMLNGRFSENEFLAKFLGYESETDNDVKSFRLKRINRKK